jgi:hypothetical protein
MSAINFPLATTSLFVNTLTTNKIIYLPAASTIGAGRLFYIKDICGNAARSSIYISTTGMDRIENRFRPSTLYALMSTNYGSVLMAPDGALNWYFLQHYHRNAISSLGSGVAAASGTFSPTSIATLVQWLDATDNTTVLTGVGGTQVANGGSAGYWGDKSGSANHVTTNAVAPVYSTSLISSRAGLNFQNSAGMISAAFAKAASITLFLVGTVKSTIGGWGTFWGHFTSGRHDADIQLRNTAGQAVINWHTNNNNSSTQLSYTLDSPVLYSCTMSGGTVMFMQQTNTTGTTSLTVTEGTLTWAAGNAPVWIGRSDSNEVINSYISEIAYFQSVLSTTDRQKMEGYLAWKYGLNTYLPAGHPHLSAAPSGPVSWKYVRFTLVLTRGQYSTKEWQMSEFTLKYQGSAVSYTGATISPVVGGGEDNPNLIDGNLGNKAFNTSISFTIFRESGFLFNAYTWATANDVPDRDPVRWIIDASQNNSTWTVLDNKSTADQTITTSRNTYVQDFSI